MRKRKQTNIYETQKTLDRNQDFFESRMISDTFLSIQNVLEQMEGFKISTKRNTFLKIQPMLRNVLKSFPARKIV